MRPDSWFRFLIILKCWNFIFNFLLQSVSEIRWYDVLILLPTEGKEVFKWACQWVSQLVNVRPHSRTGGRREVVAWAWALFNSIDDYSLSTSYNSFKALSDFWFQFHFFSSSMISHADEYYWMWNITPVSHRLVWARPRYITHFLEILLGVLDR